MKSELDRLRELKEESVQYPVVLSMMGAILELEGKFRELDQTKQDKPQIGNEAVVPNDLTNGNLINLLHKTLTAAGEQREAVATSIHKFLRSLQ